jgi:hypothetical protein
MTQKPLSDDKSARVPKPSDGKKSGTLCLFLTGDAPQAEPQAGPPAALPEGSAPAAPVRPAPAAPVRPAPAAPARPAPPYARFRFCRGFIDDLNRILPIRLRIRLEGEVSKGRTRGQVDGPGLRFRWEFLEH